MNIPAKLLYTKSHEWVQTSEDGTARIGLTDFAQDEMGDLVFVNLPEEGERVTVDEPFADVESVKAVSDIFSPVTGTVLAVNEVLLDTPEAINEAPYEAWLVQVGNISAYGPLMDAAAYAAHCKDEG